MKPIYLALALSLASPFTFAAEEKLPEPFQGATEDSNLEVSYDDLDAFLKAEVLVVGRSTRKKVSRQATTGTRMRSRINRLTALEGNRFHFESLQDEEVMDVLTTLKESLEVLPSQIPLSMLSRDEQLAYWLNLYNFTMIYEIGQRELNGSLQDALAYGDESPLLHDKVLTVAGEKLSLHDIQFTILKEKYEEPVVIYGLFQGNIGGPSIRDEAYTGNRVWRQLEDNAVEFINSNRGTYYDGEISVYYKHNLPFFDNDKTKLKTHILNYVDEDRYYEEIENASELEFEMSDWQIADLTGGARNYGGSAMINSAALLDAVRSEQMLYNEGGGSGMTGIETSLDQSMVQKARMATRFPAVQLEMLQKLKVQHEMNRGSVDVKDISEEEAKSRDKDDN